jgi:glycosyltransferase involved in cell wall biosynthesis
MFYRFSEKMERTWLRKGIRGVEYLINLIHITRIIIKGNYDIVHFQWLHYYKADRYFLKIIKKYCKAIVYTAHNVIPHVNGHIYNKELKVIYSLCDKILVHGEEVKKLFVELFPEFEHKVIIQKHGSYYNQNTVFDLQLIDPRIVTRLNSHEKAFIFVGNIFYNKGVDILLKLWLLHFKNTKHLLIIAGRTTENYPEFDQLISKIEPEGNVLLFNWYVDNNLMNFLISKSDIIVLPYRKASMSGVVFTAAEFRKPMIATNNGSISEYIIHNENSFVVGSSEDSLKYILEKVINDSSKPQLKDMGEKLNQYINENYSWNSIGDKLVKECYDSVKITTK